MDYDTAIEATITRSEAEAELKLHGFTWDDFTSDNQHYTNCETLSGGAILNWLGY